MSGLLKGINTVRWRSLVSKQRGSWKCCQPSGLLGAVVRNVRRWSLKCAIAKLVLNRRIWEWKKFLVWKNGEVSGLGLPAVTWVLGLCYHLSIKNWKRCCQTYPLKHVWTVWQHTWSRICTGMELWACCFTLLGRSREDDIGADVISS